MEKVSIRLLNFCEILFIVVVSPQLFGVGADMPAPFTRVLSLQEPPLQGKDVVILQNLLKRVPVPSTDCQGIFDKDTEAAVAHYQKLNNISSPEIGVFEAVTADKALKQLMYDGYKDDGKITEGYKFKLYIPVHRDRNIETTGILYDANNTVRFNFTVRAHGSLNRQGEALNQLTTNGNTPTGLMTCDLNSPEPDPKSFGIYPVVRAVKGLKGNSAIGSNSNNTFISNYRTGILLHTGQWEDWDPSKPMPNSNGCLHCHPDDMKKIDSILVDELGVIVNPNPFSSKDYKFKPQGLLSIEQIDKTNN